MNKGIMAVCMLAAVASGCTSTKKQASREEASVNDSLFLLVGSYAPAADEGIKVYRFNQATGEGTYISGLKGIDNPSFLTVSADGKRVYAVGENDMSTSTADALTFDRETGKLAFVNAQPTHGAAPCNIVLSPKEDYVITANYNGGNITLFPVGQHGQLEEGQVIDFKGRGPNKVRQTQPHLHCVLFTPDGRYLLANDLGTDKIHVFPVREKRNEDGEWLDRSAAYDIALKPGAGPRHICFAPNGRQAYLITELSGDVVACSYDGNRLEALQYIKADTVGAEGSADIHISPDGKFVYASNRLKADGIAIFRVNPKNGTLTKAGYQLTGLHPRNFIITPNGDYLLVACRDSNVIQVFRRDADTGLLHDTGKSIEMPRPVCLKFTGIR